MEGYKRCETGEHLVLRSKTVMSLVKQEVSLERYGTRELGAKQRVDSFQPKNLLPRQVKAMTPLLRKATCMLSKRNVDHS